jgi:hypothetical protein
MIKVARPFSMVGLQQPFGFGYERFMVDAISLDEMVLPPRRQLAELAILIASVAVWQQALMDACRLHWRSHAPSFHRNPPNT